MTAVSRPPAPDLDDRERATADRFGAAEPAPESWRESAAFCCGQPAACAHAGWCTS